MDHREKELKLFLAIEELFLTNGHVSLGINRVAKKSGLDKSYIYRKYGSFESLLEKYFKEKDFWSTKVDQMSQAIIPDSPFTFKQIIDFYLHKQFDSILSDEQLQKLMIWSISEENDLMKSFISKREKVGEDLFEMSGKFLKEIPIDFRAVSAINVAAVYYLSLHAATNNGTFCGLNLNDKEDQDKIKKAISYINGVFLK
ncbi:TetR/AcrR family transcriptional regulator [Belliella sp. R4-6]|uniref:TetR/AcrR family transcriptional regulator n=1 Tax=Belliella alkalica TaxID=1730871 RepID=A0ABS9VF82_9BACT|nr:TetR/AcrR family transcriptional regulator [Belliella alkalica]MCH7415063.1 TetR/AcrR family transcriptional regulator [Belliella alkalica]